MTVIARVEGLTAERSNSAGGLTANSVAVYVGDELAAVAEPYTPSVKGQGDVYKLIEDDRVVIIRNGKRYDVTGQKL